MLKRTVCTAVCAAMLAASPAAAMIPGLDTAGTSIAPAVSIVSAAGRSYAGEDGLVIEDGSYHYYEDGKQVKSRWVTVDDDTYYFRKNGDAAVLSCKIKGKYYVFDTKGRLQQPSSKKIVKIHTGNGTYKKYMVRPNGTAVSGWAEKKTRYFDETGEMTTGITVIKEKFYAFNSGGKYNEKKTKKLRAAAKYEQPFAALQNIIGRPEKTQYLDSCYGNGKDGILTYDTFTVYTFKPASGTEIFMGAE